MAFEQLRNNAQTTLAAGISSIDSSLSVVSASAFPVVGNFRLLIDSEIITVQSVSGTTFSSLQRGSEGTVAASHPIGAQVTQILTAGAVSQFRADGQPSYGVALGSRPSASAAPQGQVFTPNNFPIVSQDGGSSWTDVAVNPWAINTPWNSTGFSWINQGGSTVSTSNAGAEFTFPIVNGDTIHLYETTFTNTQTVTMLLSATTPLATLWANTSFFGFSFRRPASDAKVNVCGYLSSNSALPSIFNQSWTNATTFSATVSSIVGVNSVVLPNHYFWMRHTDDGTNTRISVSNDGVHWSTIALYAHATSLSGVPTTVGIFGYNSGANASTDSLILHVASWAIT